MKKLKILFSALFILLAHYINAQSLSPGIMAAQGTSSNTGGVQLQSTTGGVVNNTLTSLNILTQGFQQPELQLWTGNIVSSVCAGSVINIPFEASGIIDNANVFTAQLSDRFGNFNTALNIGTTTGNICGTITATIPANTVAGPGYKVRVKSSLAPFTSAGDAVAFTVNNVVATIPSVMAVANGASPFTVYYGYSPAASLTLTATPVSGTAPYNYLWSTGATTQSILVTAQLPAGVRVFSVTVTDALGCTTTINRNVTVSDIRCGSANKISVCTYNKRIGYTNSCLSTSQVASSLASGGKLGACATVITKAAAEEIQLDTKLSLRAMPNPSTGQFTLVTRSGKKQNIAIRIIDVYGRVLEVRTGLSTNGMVTLGYNYKAGTYFAEVIQGDDRQTIKLIKL